jgi:HEAT repeat protein
MSWGGFSADELLAVENPTPEQIEEITNLLLAPDLEMRERAVVRLIEIGQPALEPLKKMAQSDDKETRLAALSVAGEIDATAALDIIEQLLNNPDEMVRVEGMRALGSLPGGDEQAERHLDIYIRALDDPYSGVREGAAGKLAFFKGREHRKRVLEALTKTLDDPEYLVRDHAAESIRILTGTKPKIKR